MGKVEETITRLKAIREEVGTSVYDAAVKAINRMRLDSDINQRAKRISFPGHSSGESTSVSAASVPGASRQCR